MPQNQQILLDNRPTGEASASNFKLVSGETAALQEGQVLVQHHYLSLDPYMRGRMNDAKSYAQPQALGAVMQGGTVGVVLESKNPKFAVGTPVVGMGGWQQYSVVDASQAGALRKVDTTHIPLSAYLGVVGMPGVTAWYGLMKICEPKPGETVVLYANGFGPTSTPLVSGSLLQSGILSPPPVIRIGGVVATVQFAGMVSPGEFQFNVVVPSVGANDKTPIAFSLNGANVPQNMVIAIGN